LARKAAAWLTLAVIFFAALPVYAARSTDPVEDALRRVAMDLDYVRDRKAQVLAELGRCDLEAARVEYRLAAKTEEISRLEDLVREMGPVWPLQLLLGGVSERDLLNRARQVLEAEIARLEAEQAELAQKRTELEALKERLEAAEVELASRHQELRLRLVALASLSGEFGRMVAAEQAVRDLPARALEMRLPAGGPLTSGYGYRIHPVVGVPDFHEGIDLAVPEGTPVVAAEGGVVLIAAGVGDYGNTVVVDHGGGVATVYAHLSRCLVRPGQKVRAGDVVGLAGSSGLSTGPHLHFEVRVWGRPRNPLEWLKKGGG